MGSPERVETFGVWQLIINKATSVLTFLMVFVIQNTQNRDGTTIQTKLDELRKVAAAFCSIARIHWTPPSKEDIAG